MAQKNVNYYSSNNFLYSKKNSDIFIMIKLPIAHKMTKYRLYKVTSLPIPIHNTSHSTQLLDTPDYIAIFSDHTQYTYITRHELTKCIPYESNLHCQITKSLTNNNNACLIAIFDNEKEKANKCCNFRFQPNDITPKIIHLPSSSIALYQTQKPSIDCAGK